MATCPMCNVDVDETQMDDHQNTVHSNEGEQSGNKDTSSDEKA